MERGLTRGISYPSYGGRATNGLPHYFWQEKVLRSDSMFINGGRLIKGFKYASE
jgi:hypothetical protein